MSFSNINTPITTTSTTLIPEDVIRYIILPFKYQIEQIDNVEKKIQEKIKQDIKHFWRHKKIREDQLQQLMPYKVDNDHNHINQIDKENSICKKYLLDGIKKLSASEVNKKTKQIYQQRIIQILYRLLYNAIRKGLASAVAYILYKYECNPTTGNNYAVRRASEYGHIEVVKYLCELKDRNGNFVCDPAAVNNYAIRWAARNGHIEVVKYLSELTDRNGNLVCDPTANNNEAIGIATFNGHIEIVKYLSEMKDRDGNFVCDPTACNSSYIYWYRIS